MQKKTWLTTLIGTIAIAIAAVPFTGVISEAGKFRDKCLDEGFYKENSFRCEATLSRPAPRHVVHRRTVHRIIPRAYALAEPIVSHDAVRDHQTSREDRPGVDIYIANPPAVPRHQTVIGWIPSVDDMVLTQYPHATPIGQVARVKPAAPERRVVAAKPAPAVAATSPQTVNLKISFVSSR